MELRAGAPADSYVGQRVRKYFNGYGWCEGTVVQACEQNEPTVYAIHYDDGDKENMVWLNLRSILTAVEVAERVLQDPDLVLHIVQSLQVKELGLVAQVCTTWRRVADGDAALWKAVCLRSPFWALLDIMKETHPDICRRSYKALFVQRREL